MVPSDEGASCRPHYTHVISLANKPIESRADVCHASAFTGISRVLLGRSIRRGTAQDRHWLVFTEGNSGRLPLPEDLTYALDRVGCLVPGMDRSGLDAHGSILEPQMTTQRSGDALAATGWFHASNVAQDVSAGQPSSALADVATLRDQSPSLSPGPKAPALDCWIHTLGTTHPAL